MWGRSCFKFSMNGPTDNYHRQRLNLYQPAKVSENRNISVWATVSGKFVQLGIKLPDSPQKAMYDTLRQRDLVRKVELRAMSEASSLRRGITCIMIHDSNVVFIFEVTLMCKFHHWYMCFYQNVLQKVWNFLISSTKCVRSCFCHHESFQGFLRFWTWKYEIHLNFCFWFQHDSLRISLRWIAKVEIHPLWFSGVRIRHCSFVIQSKKHLTSVASQKTEQEFPCKRKASSYKPTYLPSPAVGKSTISEWQWYISRWKITRPLFDVPSKVSTW